MAYTGETLKMIAEVVKDYPNLWVIGDDVYDEVYWGSRPLTLLEVAPFLRERYIIVNGVSKSYAMAGWRIGYIIAPQDLIRAAVKFQSQSLSCACSISQYAAIAALSLSRAELKNQLLSYQKRVDFAYDKLQLIKGFDCLKPKATFYLFPYAESVIKRLGFDSDLDFCLALLAQKHLAVMPGSAFGAPGYLRLSCADNLSVLEEALTRLHDFVQ